MASDLPARLKAETFDLHRAAERTPLIARLLRGRLSLPAYCSLLRNLHPIYVALESALVRHGQHPVLAPVCLPGLARTAALEQDLAALHGADWSGALRLDAAALLYASRLQSLDPARLLAHAYVRYLGDLSGGQVLRTVVARSFGLGGGQGTAFYGFGDALQTRHLIQAFRSGLASVVLDEATTDAVVAEARLAFQLHQALFEGLESADRLATAATGAPS